jgi:hypothetical protein
MARARSGSSAKGGFCTGIAATTLTRPVSVAAQSEAVDQTAVLRAAVTESPHPHQRRLAGAVLRLEGRVSWVGASDAGVLVQPGGEFWGRFLWFGTALKAPTDRPRRRHRGHRPGRCPACTWCIAASTSRRAERIVGLWGPVTVVI